MANILIAEPSLSDAAMDAFATFMNGVSGAGEQEATPASNLFLRQPKEVWETPTITGEIELRFDMGLSALPTSYDFLALAFTNATSSATIIWDGSNSPFVWTSPVWSSGSVALVAPGQTYFPRKHAFYKISSTQTARYVRIRITDNSNPDGVFRAGRFYCCKTYQPTLNVQYPLGFGFDDAAPEVVTSAGERIARANEPIPNLAFTLQASGSGAQAEFYDNLHEIMRRVGSSRDVMVIIDPSDASYSGAMLYYGTLQQKTQIALQSHRFYESAFELRGLI